MTPSPDPYLRSVLDHAEAARVDEDELEGLVNDLGAVVGDRVREFRNSLHPTVADLADRIGMSKGMLSKVENNRASASLSTLARLSVALNVPITAFFRGLDEEHEVVFVRSGQGLALTQDRPRPGAEYRLLGMLRGQHQRLEPLLITFMTDRSSTWMRPSCTAHRVDHHIDAVAGEVADALHDPGSQHLHADLAGSGLREIVVNELQYVRPAVTRHDDPR